MHPDLFHIGPLTVRTYGLAMAVSFLVGFYLAARRAPRERIDPELVLDCFLPVFIGAILGARILYIFTDIRTYIENPLEILKIWRGGLVWYGGFIGALIGAYLFLRYKKHGFWKMMDLMAPYAGLGYAIHRTFGCFGGFGCCYGKPTDLPFPLGVTFPEGAPASRIYGFGQPVHPTQLYESINGLIIMAVLMLYRRNPHSVGKPSAIFLLIYAVMRFLIEFLRGDPYRGFIGPLSTSQFISIPLIILAIILWFRKTDTETPLNKEDAQKFMEELTDEHAAENGDSN